MINDPEVVEWLEGDAGERWRVSTYGTLKQVFGSVKDDHPDSECDPSYDCMDRTECMIWHYVPDGASVRSSPYYYCDDEMIIGNAVNGAAP